MSIIQGRGGTGDAIVVPRGTLGKDNNIKDGRQITRKMVDYYYVFLIQ